MSWTRRIARGLVSHGIIPDEDLEIYEFGAGQLLFQAINVITTVGIALLCDMLPQCLLFLASYIPLRSFAGGFHAKTQIRCYILSNVMIVAALCAIRMVPAAAWVCLLLTLPGASVIFLLAPVQDRNKPLSGQERLVYRRRSRWILLVLILICAGSFAIGRPVWTLCIGTAVSALSIMLLLGALKNWAYVRGGRADHGSEG